uniref:hypothetical protein n=1 Tax=Salmonella sp. SAL4431 TaxID=3159886 RepID=UPI00397B888F
VLADADGRREADLTLLTLAFDDSGEIVAQAVEPIPVRLDPEAYGRARAHGLLYSVRLPVKRPGGYQVRAVIREERSERVG